MFNFDGCNLLVNIPDDIFSGVLVFANKREFLLNELPAVKGVLVTGFDDHLVFFARLQSLDDEVSLGFDATMEISC